MRLPLTLNPDPVVGEQDMLAGIDLRHVASKAALRGRNRAGGGGNCMRISGVRARCRRPCRPVTAQANSFVTGRIGACPCMRVVTRHAGKAAAGALETLRLRKPDRLEPRKCRIVLDKLVGRHA